MLSSAAKSRLVIIGANHRTSSPELRERFALIEATQASFLDALSAHGLREAMLLATCDRVELVASVADGATPEPIFRSLLAERFDDLSLDAALYRHEGEAALAHLFEVTSALDSFVIGEPQVLGQIKAAHRAAAAQGLVGADLEAVLAAAYGAARRVRRETRIAERPVSIASSALNLSREIHGDLADRAALLLGPSEIGVLMTEQFQRAGVKRLVVCGPEPRAAQAAAPFGANVLSLAEIDDGLAAADIVIAALGSGRTILTAPRVAAVMKRRPLRPIFIIDVGFPADADPTVNDIDGVFLYDLGDLERLALVGRAGREAEAAAARRIIAEELARFARRAEERRAVPAVVALRGHVERLRQAALAEAKGDAEAATRLLVNRLLHDPSEVLRDLAADSRDLDPVEELLRRLFRLSADAGEET